MMSFSIIINKIIASLLNSFNFWVKYLSEFIISIVVTVAVAFIHGHSIALEIVILVLIFVSVVSFREFKGSQEFLISELTNFRNDALSDSAAFSISCKYIHQAIDHAVRCNGPMKWIALKIIDFKLKKDFSLITMSQLDFVVDQSYELSELLGILTRKCKTEITFTFPYTPEKWVRIVYPEYSINHEPCTSIENCLLLNDILTKRIPLPDHLQYLKDSTVSQPERFVTFAWNGKANCHLYVLALCSIITNIKTYFVDTNNPILNTIINFDDNVLDGISVSHNMREKRIILNLDPEDTKRKIATMKAHLIEDPREWTLALEWAAKKCKLLV